MLSHCEKISTLVFLFFWGFFFCIFCLPLWGCPLFNSDWRYLFFYLKPFRVSVILVIYSYKSVIRVSTLLIIDNISLLRYLIHKTAVMVANAMVNSRLDYCNCLLYHITKANIDRLQRVQTTLCLNVYTIFE